MGDGDGAEASTSTTDGNDGGATSTATDSKFEPISTQEEFDARLKDRLSREKAKFSDYKDLKAKADKFDELEAANKSEIEKATDRVAAAEAEVATIPAKVADALRTHLVDLGVVDKDDEVLLTASDPEALLAQVKRLGERSAERKKNGNTVPKEGAAPNAAPSDERAFVRDLFGK